MSDIVVHGIPGSPYLRATLLGLEEKGLDYKLAGVAPGSRRSPEHLARHPFGRIPVFQQGDFRLYETQAILRYIDTLSSQSPLQPREAQAAARMNQVAGIVDWYVFPTLGVRICAERLMSQYFWQRPANEATIEAAVPDARVCIQELERLKGSAPFMAGETLSIADLMLIPHILFFSLAPEGAMLKGTGIEDWMKRMSARPSVQATERDRLVARAG